MENEENEDEEEELDNSASETEIIEKPNCFSKCLYKIKVGYMIDPENRKLKHFHMIFALSFYADVIMTSLMIGNYDF